VVGRDAFARQKITQTPIAELAAFAGKITQAHPQGTVIRSLRRIAIDTSGHPDDAARPTFA
jgi:hypothetical protein